MKAKLDEGYSLRNALPIGLLLIAVGLLAFFYLTSIANGRTQALERARIDVVLDTERLARQAQRELIDQPSHVESDIAVASAEQRSAMLVLLDPQGVIVMAHRLAWRGRPAADLIPNFSRERFERVARGRSPDVQELSSPPRLTVMVPYITEGKTARIRNDGRGVIYQEYDLSYDYELVQWEVQQRMWPLLVVALLTALALAHLMRIKVTQPLARAEQASLQLAQSTVYPAPLEVSGPREIARLAQGFNVMIERIQAAQRDSETSRARLAAIVEAAMDAIITVDGQHRIMVINAAALAMFGCREQEVLGQPVHILLPERYRQAHRRHVGEFAQHSSMTSRAMGRQAVVTGRRMNGEEFPAEASISNILVDGETLLTVILRDVTERQKAQDAILALNSNLEAQVQQRTVKLTETAQMLEAQQRVLRAAHEEQRTILTL